MQLTVVTVKISIHVDFNIDASPLVTSTFSGVLGLMLSSETLFSLSFVKIGSFSEIKQPGVQDFHSYVQNN